MSNKRIVLKDRQNNEYKCDLNRCFLCSNGAKRHLPVVAENRQIFAFNKGEIIFREGDQTSGIYFLTSGNVKIHRHWGDNKELILHFCREGDILGYRGMGSNKSFTVTATALTHCTACYVDLKFFEQSLRNDHRLTYNFLNFHFNELQETEKRMGELVHLDVSGRTANTLLMLATKFGVTDKGYIDIRLKRQDMAAYAGTTYETFFRVMDKFEKEKLIHVQGKDIQLIDVEKLKDYGAGFYYKK